MEEEKKYQKDVEQMNKLNEDVRKVAFDLKGFSQYDSNQALHYALKTSEEIHKMIINAIRPENLGNPNDSTTN